MKNLLIITQKVDEDDQLLGFFIEWLKRFAGKFGNVTVLCLEKGKFDLPKNVEVISLGKDRGAGKLKQLSTFYFQLFTLKYDAVFVHMNPIWAILGGPYWRLAGKKVCLWYTHKAITSKLKLAEKFVDVIFTASKESFRLPSKKVIVTGHGIDTSLFRPSEKLKVESGKLKILSVGRIAPVKNYGTLIDASKILKDKGTSFLVTMVGEIALNSDASYLASLKFKVKSLKLEENFKFVGKINHKELPSYYRSHDIFVHLSKTGSIDKTLLEAMACGMKVLSSNDSARSFLNQTLCFKEDDSHDLAGKIIEVSKIPPDPALRDYVIKNHDLDKLIERLSATIKNRISQASI